MHNNNNNNTNTNILFLFTIFFEQQKTILFGFFFLREIIYVEYAGRNPHGE